jgi:hypothetical protein
MPANLQKQMLGGDGVMRYVDSTSPITAASGYLFDYVIINDSATVVSVLEDENGVSLVSSAQWNIANKALSTGILLIGKNGARIRAVTVTAGSVIGYQSRDYGNLRL